MSTHFTCDPQRPLSLPLQADFGIGLGARIPDRGGPARWGPVLRKLYAGETYVCNAPCLRRFCRENARIDRDFSVTLARMF